MLFIYFFIIHHYLYYNTIQIVSLSNIKLQAITADQINRAVIELFRMNCCRSFLLFIFWFRAFSLLLTLF